MKSIKKTFPFGNHQVTLETGEIARQADGAVLVTMDDTVVLVTCVGRKDVKVGQDFFPAHRRLPGERPTPRAAFPAASSSARDVPPRRRSSPRASSIARCARFFPHGFYNEVQVIATVLSINPEVDSDIPAMIGASAAVTLSGIPFDGPIGAARVGYIDGEYILNPTKTELETSQLNLVVAGTEQAVLMVESEANELSEEVMLGAVMFGHEQMQAAINAINELADEGGKDDWDWEAKASDAALVEKIRAIAESDLGEAYRMKSKSLRQEKLEEIKRRVLDECVVNAEVPADSNVARGILKEMEAKIVRGQILNGEPRIDGRNTRTVRPISIRPTLLPRVHGSVLFTRGETQAIVTTTLGTGQDEQSIDALQGEYTERFMMHYNFPPFSTGETGRVGSPKRREIGHGRLAKRALLAVLPAKEEFGYTLRVVSEITESNGSSSMATVCGGCLALMDAGVPLKGHVAGIAMGLIKDGGRFAVLTDILGDEDHLGDMDFKVAGTEQGITALQMDIKITGITREIMKVALDQAKEGRMHILGIMKQAVPGPRVEMSNYAPRIIKMKINPDKIREVIGKGGSVIQALTRETGTTIDIEDDGTISIACLSAEAGEAAQEPHQCDHRGSRSRQGVRGPGAAAPRLRRDHPAAARQGRPAAHLADRARARERGLGLPEGRPDREGEGARGRRQGRVRLVEKGAARSAAAPRRSSAEHARRVHVASVKRGRV